MKSKKIKRISLRNTIFNFFNIAALGFVLVIGLTFLFQIILPLLNNIKDGQEIYQKFNDFIARIQDKNQLNDLFEISKQIDPSNISLIGAIQTTYNNIEKQLQEIFDKFLGRL